MLIKPVAAAAADAVRVRDGRVQKGEIQKKPPNAVKQSHTIWVPNP
jgi:hypothetical protein